MLLVIILCGGVKLSGSVAGSCFVSLYFRAQGYELLNTAALEYIDLLASLKVEEVEVDRQGRMSSWWRAKVDLKEERNEIKKGVKKL